MLAPGQVVVRLAGIGTYVQTQHDDHDDTVQQGHIPLVHDQELLISESRLTVDVGLTKKLSASLFLPFRVVSTDIRYLDLAGTEVDLVRSGIHHRNETVGGIVDPFVLAAYAHDVGGFRLVGRAGLSLPLGSTEDNPFTPAAEVMPHQHIQLGTGTFNPVLSAEVSRGWGPWRAGVFAFTQQVLYENGKGYHAGDRYSGGLTVIRRLNDRWSVRGGAEVQAETAERWDGIEPVDDGNRGRLDVILGAGAQWRATDHVAIDLALKVPVVTHAVNGQLAMPAIVELGVAWSFGSPSRSAPAADDHHDDEHDHDHGDEHDHAHDDDEHAHGEGAHADTTGLDVADLGPPGAAVQVEPVPGKITIYDFWAAWCEPCKTLDPVLVELARTHPDRIAIRRVDVVDWDSAAAATHLTPGGFDLPHLKIFDASGALVLEKGTKGIGLDGLIREVRALVESQTK